jgi:hypothetical protein
MQSLYINLIKDLKEWKSTSFDRIIYVEDTI